MNARVLELAANVLPRERLGLFRGQAGLLDAPEVAPASPEECRAFVDLARAERWKLLPLGGGSKLGWRRAPEQVDCVLSSRSLRGVVAYEPADGTLTARAGTPWSELVETTRPRHHLSPELGFSEAATLGGVLAAGQSGLDRLRHGPLRHQVLGMLTLQADGTFVKSGGRVVKNVTGYDLHRLWCGSMGTLGFVLEATLRLYPAPAEEAVLRGSAATLAEALASSHALWRAGLQAVAVVIASEDRSALTELEVVLAGRAEAVAHEIGRARQTTGILTQTLYGQEARTRRAQLAAREARATQGGSLLLSGRPSRLPAALQTLESACSARGLTPRLCLHPLLASACVDFPGADAQALAGLAQALAVPDFALAWRGGLARHSPPSEAARALMTRLKEALDPGDLFTGSLP